MGTAKEQWILIVIIYDDNNYYNVFLPPNIFKLITKYDRYYKVRQILQSATKHAPLILHQLPSSIGFTVNDGRWFWSDIFDYFDVQIGLKESSRGLAFFFFVPGSWQMNLTSFFNYSTTELKIDQAF